MIKLSYMMSNQNMWEQEQSVETEVEIPETYPNDRLFADERPAMRRILAAGLRSLGLDKRSALVAEIDRLYDEVFWAGLRAQYPNADELELKYQACRVRYGDEVARDYRAALLAQATQESATA